MFENSARSFDCTRAVYIIHRHIGAYFTHVALFTVFPGIYANKRPTFCKSWSSTLSLHASCRLLTPTHSLSLFVYRPMCLRHAINNLLRRRVLIEARGREWLTIPTSSRKDKQGRWYVESEAQRVCGLSIDRCSRRAYSLGVSVQAPRSHSDRTSWQFRRTIGDRDWNIYSSDRPMQFLVNTDWILPCNQAQPIIIVVCAHSWCKKAAIGNSPHKRVD